MIIKSSEKMCQNYGEFSRLAHATGEPIYITHDGEGDLVLLSIEAYESLLSSPEKNEIKSRKQEDNMTIYVLGNVLKEMYQTSPKGQQVTNIHTFAIYYAKAIEENRIGKKEILKVAGLPESYQTEISKGINLAAYVEVKQGQVERIQKIESKYL